MMERLPLKVKKSLTDGLTMQSEVIWKIFTSTWLQTTFALQTCESR